MDRCHEKGDIPQWAYTAVAYGLESGIVSTNDIEIFIKDDGTNRDSTRENVAVIFGKALSHISKVNTSAELSFKDKAEITGDKRTVYRPFGKAWNTCRRQRRQL